MAKRKMSTFAGLRHGKINRKQQRELERRINSEDSALEVVHPNAAGIDIGNESHFVAIPPERDPVPYESLDHGQRIYMRWRVG
jgi:hypothetical protein